MKAVDHVSVDCQEGKALQSSSTAHILSSIRYVLNLWLGKSNRYRRSTSGISARTFHDITYT